MDADRRLQIGPVECFAEQPAEFAVQADIGFGVGELADIGEMTAEREGHVDLGADAFDQAADLGQIGGWLKVP
jgi:hypothetical protein